MEHRNDREFREQVEEVPDTAETGEHDDPCCPFLNGLEVHCDRYVRLDRLKLAFDYCFANYTVCPEYERLTAAASEDSETERNHAAFAKLLVQVRINSPSRAGHAVHT